MHKLKWIYHHVHRFKTEFIRKIRHCPYDCQFHTLQGGIHMFLRIKNKHEQITKTQVYLTGSLVNILRAGMPVSGKFNPDSYRSGHSGGISGICVF